MLHFVFRLLWEWEVEWRKEPILVSNKGVSVLFDVTEMMPDWLRKR